MNSRRALGSQGGHEIRWGVAATAGIAVPSEPAAELVVELDGEEEAHHEAVRDADPEATVRIELAPVCLPDMWPNRNEPANGGAHTHTRAATRAIGRLECWEGGAACQ